jgi:GNAT superfamily N-acetyltransferase
MSDLVIRPVAAADEPAWRKLWAGYLAFYRTSVPKEVTAQTFARILDPASLYHGLVAELEGAVIGLCTSVFHDHTFSLQPICYLHDLYVDKARRGTDAARQLILACEADAKARGAFRIYWQTQEYNGPARSLYDTITPRSSFIVYRKNLG